MSLRTPPTGRSSPSVNPHGNRVHLYNEEPERRTVSVVVRDSDGQSVERVTLPGGGTARLGLPAASGPLTVGCHSDDGRSGVRTCRSGDTGPVVFSLRKGSILLDGW